MSFWQVKSAELGDRWNVLRRAATPWNGFVGLFRHPGRAWAWWFASLNHPWSMVDGEVM
jgi:hypothetical protein